MTELSHELAHPDFYLPLSVEDEDEPWAPSVTPPGWTMQHTPAWRTWMADGVEVNPDAAGWKVHVSATLTNVQRVLDAVTTRCAELGIPFKHLSGPLHYRLMHHKHGPRTQAGKVCTLYPATVEQARRVMELLSDDLAGLEGPYVLTDRRFGENGVVYYRYGAHAGIARLELDGTQTPMVLGPDGNWTPDRREPTFSLPPGVSDPFVLEEPKPANRDFLLHDRYRILGVLGHSNAGGVYRALDTTNQATVVIKEGRGHNGLSWDGADAQSRLQHEFSVLEAVHAAEPGLCPAPIEHFAVWENTYLAMELVPGIRLLSWLSMNGTLQDLASDPATATDYLRRARGVLDQVNDQLERLHDLGVAFGDLNLNNLLIDSQDRVRLIDFEAAGSLSEGSLTVGAPGFTAPADLAGTLLEQDRYAFAALSSVLLLPLLMPMERDPVGRLELWRRDVEAVTAVPEEWWTEATRYYARDRGGTPTPTLPTAAELDKEPLVALSELANHVAQGLLAMGDVLDAEYIFPTSTDGHASNTICLAHGDAGVLWALQEHGVDPDQLRPWWGRLVDRALTTGEELPPGMRVGSAGIAVALAGAGHIEPALELLAEARQHRLLGTSLGFGLGAAGVGQAHLAVQRLHPEDALLDAATRIGDAVVAQLDQWCASDPVPGLTLGLTGTGLFLHDLAGSTGESRYRDAAHRLAEKELSRGTLGADGVRSFHDTEGRRVIGYLGIGSAGVSLLLGRLAAAGDHNMDEAQRQVLAGIRTHTSIEPGLENGVASWAYAWYERGRLLDDPEASATAVRIGTAMAKYLVRVNGGLMPVGSLSTKLRADLSGGGAGVLAVLNLLTGHPSRPYGLSY